MSLLSSIYDSLYSDSKAIKQYQLFLNKYNLKGPVLECACGSGDLALLLQEEHVVDGLDFNQQMLRNAKAKGFRGQLYHLDMSQSWELEKQYQSILCFGDSLNYLSDLNQVESFFEEVFTYLEDDGSFFFDMHSLDRLEEFNEEYIEEALVDGKEVMWSCVSIGDKLVHQWVFYGEQGHQIEEIVQTVFDPEDIESLLKKTGFNFYVMTDFDKVGYQEGEKYFYVCQKEKQ